jgi:hypothetical protein
MPLNHLSRVAKLIKKLVHGYEELGNLLIFLLAPSFRRFPLILRFSFS